MNVKKYRKRCYELAEWFLEQQDEDMEHNDGDVTDLAAEIEVAMDNWIATFKLHSPD